MKNSSLKIFSAVVILLLAGCFGWGEDEATKGDSIEAAEIDVVIARKEIPDFFYISKNPSECRSVFFSCPTGRISFTDEIGCGCLESDEPFKEEQKGLGNMIREKLARELFQPKCDGGVLAEFIYIDEGEVSAGNMNYDVWAIAREIAKTVVLARLSMDRWLSMLR